MKIEGIVKLVFRDINTGEITREETHENNTMNFWLESTLLSLITNSKFGPNIFISEFNPPATDPYSNRIKVIRTGVAISGVTSPISVKSTDTTFAYGEWHQRFTAPVSDININSIGLTLSSILPTATARDTIVQAYVKLPTTLVQLTTETLDVFYRVQFPYDHFLESTPYDPTDTGLSGIQSDAVLGRFVSGTTGEFFGAMHTGWNGNTDVKRIFHHPAISNTQNSSTPLSGTYSFGKDIKTHKISFNTEIEINEGVGMLIGQLIFGTGTDGLANNPWAGDVDSDVIQNVFGHSPASILPFFDSLEQPTGFGWPTLNGDSWTNTDFPKLYRFNVTGTGPNTTGTYQFQVRPHFGFALNTLTDPIRVVQSLHRGNAHLHDGLEFTTGLLPSTTDMRARPVFIKFPVDNTPKHVLAITKTEVYPLNLQTEVGEGPLFNSTNFPAFTPTSTTQVALDGLTIYVGCRDSGIYKIVDPLGTPVITHIDNTTTGLTLTTGQCYGVEVGVGGRLWAIFDSAVPANGGLFTSADGGVNWTQSAMTNATLMADWTLVKYIKADPTHADHRIAMVYQDVPNTTGNYYALSLLWWNENNGLDVQGPGLYSLAHGGFITIAYTGQFKYNHEEPWTYFKNLTPSPTQNKWGMAIPLTQADLAWNTRLTYLEFDTTTKIQFNGTGSTVNQLYIDWELDGSGDQNIIGTTYVGTTDAYMTLYKDNDTWLQNRFIPTPAVSYAGELRIVYEGACCYLGNLTTLSADLNSEGTSSPQAYYLHTAGERYDAAGGELGFLLWDSYGWTGSAWVKDDAGSKPFHSAAETLVDGVTVAFDDDGGSPTAFVLDDFYTCGVTKGVWLDGGTQFNNSTGIYFQGMLVNQTDLEVGVLPGTVRSPEILERVPADDVVISTPNWQDVNKLTIWTGSVIFIVSGGTTLYDSGARLVEHATGTGITNKSANDTVHTRFVWGFYTPFHTLPSAVTAGLSPVTVLTSPIDRATIKYGIELVPEGTITHLGNINIWESGIEVAHAVRTCDTAGISSYAMEVEILNDGTVNYYVWSTYNVTDVTLQPIVTMKQNTRDLVYTSTGSAPIEDYYADVAMNGFSNSAGVKLPVGSTPATIWPTPVGPYLNGSMRLQSRVPDDYYITVGNFTNNTGRYEPNFWAINTTQNFDILIAGTAPTLILDGDTTTVLNAGEVSLFARQGFIRYSAADAGKTITASYSVLVEN